VRRMHDRVRGQTEGGEPYSANGPELLDWVQATAAFGFLEAYAADVRPVRRAERDAYYAEGKEAARLYGAAGAPGSQIDLEAMFARMRPRLERSEVVFEFLRIMDAASVLPGALRMTQGLFIRAAVEIVPGWTRELLGLGSSFGLTGWEAALVRAAGAAADRIALPSNPAAQACRRLGLPEDYLYRAH